MGSTFTVFIPSSPLAAPCLKPDRGRSATTLIMCAKPAPTTSENRKHAPIHTPTHKRIPYIGTILDFFDESKRPDKLVQRYGPVYRTDFVGQHTLVVADYETGREVLKDRGTFVCNGSWPTPVLNAIGYKFPGNIDGREHIVARKRISPLFMNCAINRATSQSLPIFRSMWRRTHSQVIESTKTNGVDIRIILREHFLKGIMMHTMGNTVDDNTLKILRKLYSHIINGLVFPWFTPQGFLAVQYRKKLLDIVSKVIKEHARSNRSIILELRESENISVDIGEQKEISPKLRGDVIKGKVDLLSVLCAVSGAACDEAQTPSEDTKRIIDELSDQILFIWFASSSTTPASLSNAVFELGKDRSLVEELREELFKKLDGLKDVLRENELVSCACNPKNKLPKLSAFLEEVLRFHPPAPIFRKSSRDSFIRGHSVSKGDLIMIDTFGGSRCNGNFENAGVFQADRFLDKENGIVRESPILTFGAPGSPHFCMGYQLARCLVVLGVCTLIDEWEFEIHPSVAEDQYAYVPEPGPKNGMRLIGLTERNCSNL